MNGLTAWDLEAKKGKKEILEKVWGWGRKVHVNVKNDLLLAKDRIEKTEQSSRKWLQRDFKNAMVPGEKSSSIPQR